MSSGTSEFSLLFTGSQQILAFNATNLTTGQKYQFYLKASNFNGDSVPSDILQVYSCLQPAIPSAPTRVTGSRTSLTLQWLPPSSNGGCNITGYSLYSNDGLNGLIQTEVNAAQLANKPFVLQTQVLFLSSDTASTFKFQLKVSNQEGSSMSNVASFIIADVPDQPILPPTAIVTSASSMSVSFTPLSLLQNGGSAIFNYELQLDDGKAGAFTSILNNSLDTTVTVSNLT